MPALHVCPTPHAFPQVPQLLLSVWVLTHVPLQLVRPPVHTQVLDWQVWLAPQAVAQLPQWVLLEVRS